MAYAGLLTVVGGVALATATAAPAGRPSPLAPVDLTPTLAGLRRDVAIARAERQSLRAVSAVPDWSVLLRALADALGPDVRLRDVAIGGEAGVTVDGVGASPRAVTDFVVRVERLRFFGSVRLVQTGPAAEAGRDGVGFRLACALPNAGQERP